MDASLPIPLVVAKTRGVKETSSHNNGRSNEQSSPSQSSSREIPTFKFPKRSFGSQGKDRRSFRGEWCDTYHWLHYDVSSDSAFCHVCMVAEFERKFLASTKRDPAFISAGFTYWKEAVLHVQNITICMSILYKNNKCIYLTKMLSDAISEHLF